jgi:glycosyltransferase involved in cell wall biosynthesis
MTLAFTFIALRHLGYYGFPIGVLLSDIIYTILILCFLVKPQFKFIDTAAILKFILLNLIVNSSIMLLMKLILSNMFIAKTMTDKLMLLFISTLFYSAGFIFVGLCIRDIRTIINEIFLYLKSALSHRIIAITGSRENCEGRKRICFMLHRAYPLFNPECKGVFGGAEVNLYFLAYYFSKNPAFSVKFYVGDYGQKDVEEYDSIAVKKFKYTNSDKYDNLYYKTLRYIFLIRELLFSNCDVYITSTADELLGFMAFFLRKIMKKRLIFRLSSDSNTDPSSIKKKGKRTYILYKYGLLNSDAIVCQTNYQQAILRHNLNLNSVVIKNGFPIKDSIDIKSKKYILWVSRAVAMKRPELFIELAKRLPNESFVIIIPGNNTVSFKAYEECRKLTNIRFIDYVPFLDTQKYFEEAKLFVNTSEFEGFPNTFIQSCLAKTPILSFKVDPDKFLSKNNIGFCCNDSMDAAVEFIRKLGKKKINYYGKNGLSYVVNNHDLNKTAVGYEELINKLLSGM